MAFALIRYRLLDIVPIAHSVLIENMSEGVLVLDSRNRVVDINPAAQNVLSSKKLLIGEPVEKAFVKWTDFVGRFFDENQASAEISVADRYLDLRISPLLNRRNRFVGKLVVWRDITDLKNTQLKLEKLATTDELTLTYNRRHFMELAEAQINESRRHGHPLALALIDLDYFKKINDNYGHHAGDIVLSEFARSFRENIRDFDIFGRLGGEEFALLMPGTDDENAFQVADRLRLLAAKTPIDLGERSVSITFSLGLTALVGEQDTLGSLMRRADHALYAAKKTGRNRVTLWKESTDAKSAFLADRE
jgi:diguanylate cyclase (GGDEF)-like protein